MTVTVTVTNVALMGKMGTQPILPITVSVKKIKGAAHQRYGEGDRVVRCEQTIHTERQCLRMGMVLMLGVGCTGIN